MSSNQKTFLFASILCISCSFLLTFATTSLKPLQEENIRVDQQKNILKVLDVLDLKKKYSLDELSKLYNMYVKNAWVDSSGTIYESEGTDRLPIYFRLKEGHLDAYAIPISGYGLWSTLYGYFAMDKDAEHVVGITFYQHGETPGLGAECEKPWFQNNFKGKRILNKMGELVSIGIAKGNVSDSVPLEKQINYVDGISGATVTSRGIETFLKEGLVLYEPFAKRLRSGDFFSIGD